MRVDLSKKAQKQLTKIPAHVVRKFALWVDLVTMAGLNAARAIPGYRDHALKGQWQGYHAVRLNDAYRAIYIERDDGSLNAVHVEEVNKHDY